MVVVLHVDHRSWRCCRQQDWWDAASVPCSARYSMLVSAPSFSSVCGLLAGFRRKKRIVAHFSMPDGSDPRKNKLLLLLCRKVHRTKALDVSKVETFGSIHRRCGREGLRHRCFGARCSLRSQAKGSLGPIRVSCRQVPTDGPEVPSGLCINQGGEVVSCASICRQMPCIGNGHDGNSRNDCQT